MGLFDKLFGSKKDDASDVDTASRQAPRPSAKAKPAADATAPIDDDHSQAVLLRSVASGESIDLADTLESLDDDAGFELLWELLAASREHARVEVIDCLADFELDAEQQRTLICSAVQHVPGPQWVAASVALCCDLGAVAQSLQPGNEADLPVFDATSTILAALFEVTLTTGPAGNALDVPRSADYTGLWGKALVDFGARTEDLVAVAMAEQLCRQGQHDEELWDAGFDDKLELHLANIKQSLIAAGSRDGAWNSVLPGALQSGELPDALVAMQAAAVASVAVRPALLSRVTSQPSDEPTWDLALAAGLDGDLLGQLAPVGAATLQFRRLGEDQFHSPASQVGCLKCGGGGGATDDDMMVPTALRDRLLPLLLAIKEHPGVHPDFLVECLAAPDPSLRYHALIAFAQWHPPTIPATAKFIVDQLVDDSMPAVQNQAMELRRAYMAA